ncbi:cytochrome P450-like protein [Dichotomopilus funicola]|uniref:Cytochrome P450-like protein n=1 Tax=Dichotomopilus funicola TaxID=1934379 RepID=A0AAN6V1D1_9PEZI|nr:cytochrome P450-like protein [Dichotomopilus funicola]
MASLLLALAAFLLWATAWTVYSAYTLYCNYLEARTLGVPIRIIPIDHLNKLWLLVDKQVVALVRRLPGVLGNNNFTRFNYRGWHEDDGLRAHDEMGEAFVLCTPSRNWLYLADPDALINMYRRGKDFPRWVEITKMLDVFGGPTIATASGEEWRRIRKISNSALNEQCNAIVWSESAALGEAMSNYWASQGVFTSVGEDSRTVTLHVLSKACFGQSLPFEGHHGRASDTSASASFRFSLLTIMENALLILALTPSFFTNRWLPMPAAWRKLGEACDAFRGHMRQLYQRELRVLEEKKLTPGEESLEKKRDYTLMAALVRASQERPDEKDEEDRRFANLTEAEIYGNMFVFAFAGHDTTAHLLTYAVFFLAANPTIQTWVADEIQQVLGTRPRSEWDYHADFPRLKRCLAILYETLRVKTPVCEVKWTEDRAQQLRVAGQMLTVPPQTLMIPSYLYVHKHARYWGSDAMEWQPERWIATRGAVNEAGGLGEGGLHAGNNGGYHRRARPHVVEDEKDESADISQEGEEEVLLPPPSRGNYLGWSEGARDCPGKRFSHVEWAAFLAAMFRDWKVEPQQLPGETFAESRTRVLDFVEKDTDYGGLLLQLMHPEKVPLVWSRR